jgi:hypothetical protein
MATDEVVELWGLGSRYLPKLPTCFGKLSSLLLAPAQALSHAGWFLLTAQHVSAGLADRILLRSPVTRLRHRT